MTWSPYTMTKQIISPPHQYYTHNTSCSPYTIITNTSYIPSQPILHTHNMICSPYITITKVSYIHSTLILYTIITNTSYIHSQPILYTQYDILTYTVTKQVTSPPSQYYTHNMICSPYITITKVSYIHSQPILYTI